MQITTGAIAAQGELIAAFTALGAELVVTEADEEQVFYDVLFDGESVESVVWTDGIASWGRDRMNIEPINSAAEVAKTVLLYAAVL